MKGGGSGFIAIAEGAKRSTELKLCPDEAMVLLDSILIGHGGVYEIIDLVTLRGAVSELQPGCTVTCTKNRSSKSGAHLISTDKGPF